MPRSVNSAASKARRKRILKEAKGFYGKSKNVYTVAKKKIKKGEIYIPMVLRFNFDNHTLTRHKNCHANGTYVNAMLGCVERRQATLRNADRLAFGVLARGQY